MNLVGTSIRDIFLSNSMSDVDENHVFISDFEIDDSRCAVTWFQIFFLFMTTAYIGIAKSIKYHILYKDYI